MRVLAHVHTLNDEAVIEQALEGLRRQTRPPDGIVIVDNGSTDRTLDRNFPANVTVVRNASNLGTTGAVVIGLQHAQEHGYDWAWLFDADSVPEPDALEKLLGFFETLSPAEQERACFLGCRLAGDGSDTEHRPIILTRSGIEFVPFDPEAAFCRCDCFIWSGSLFRMAAVRKIGLPMADYVLDLSELEYGYRAQRLGFTGYIVNGALLNHDVGRPPGVTVRVWRFGPISFRLLELPPRRCYYHVRNMLYFWLHQCRPRRPLWVLRSLAHSVFYPRTFAVRPFTHGRHLIACFRGAWDGLTGHMERRY